MLIILAFTSPTSPPNPILPKSSQNSSRAAFIFLITPLTSHHLTPNYTPSATAFSDSCVFSSPLDCKILWNYLWFLGSSTKLGRSTGCICRLRGCYTINWLGCSLCFSDTSLLSIPNRQNKGMKFMLFKASIREVLHQHSLSSNCFKICPPCLSYIISFNSLSSLLERLLEFSLSEEGTAEK